MFFLITTKIALTFKINPRKNSHKLFLHKQNTYVLNPVVWIGLAY